MKPTRKVSRRSFMHAVAGAAAGGAMLAIGTRANAQASDADSGPSKDPAGRGETGYTDGDSGANADRANHGRRPRACTDSDSGPNADRGNNGRGNRRSDNDPTDQGGCGRR
jgi:hypothetical protein